MSKLTSDNFIRGKKGENTKKNVTFRENAKSGNQTRKNL